jgi:hypothetical protein
LTVVPEQVHLHGHWLGKRHQECPSTGWPRGDPNGVIFFAFFQFRNMYLSISIYPPTHPSIHPSIYTVTLPFYHNLSATLNAVLCSEMVGCATVHNACGAKHQLTSQTSLKL